MIQELLTMNEQKPLEVILRVFRGEKSSCEVAVSLEVSGCNFSLAQSQMLLSYLRSTGNIKAKVGSRSSFKSQIRRAKVSAQKKKSPDNQSTG
jgi:hypothetical protein